MDWISYLNKQPELIAFASAIHGIHVRRETFVLPDLWALHFYDYEGLLHAGGHCFNLLPGSATLLPPAVPATYIYQGPSQHIYCHFRIPKPIKAEASPVICMSPSSQLTLLKKHMADGLRFYHHHPLRARVRLWDVLLELAALQQNEEHYNSTTTIDKAINIIEKELASPIRIAELASRCGMSHNQFIRIVHEQTNYNPQAWINRIRTDRAHELLAYSDVPIKVIASEVGLPDLQHFNKCIRKRFGVSPRSIRKKRETTNYK